MNTLYKIINQIIVFLNRFIDSLDKRTVELIKQSYYLLVFIIVVAGIFIGYNHGKEAAKGFGAPIAEFTDDVFDVIIKTEKENVDFSSLLDGKSIREKEESMLKKQEYPSNEKLEFESNHNIVEPDTEAKKISAAPQADDRERPADVKRLDESEPEEGVRELERRSSPYAGEKKSLIIKDADDAHSEINTLETRESSSPAVQKAKPIVREKKELLPMDKNDRVLEK